jgi:pimeloyl-ACP methyl ester carboxylesterase
LGALALAIAGGTFYQSAAEARDRRRYPPPGRFVSVGEHRLHLNLAGQGSPLVVLDAGLGGSSLDWSLVQPEVAKLTRVCCYDRAGYGWSDPGPAPRTSRRIVDELHVALKNAGLEPPYILVGHSFGGFNVRFFAGHYPEEVAGLVLVDASHPRQFKRLPAHYRRMHRAQSGLGRLAPLLARIGVLRALRLPVASPGLPPSIRPVARALGFQTRAYAAAGGELTAFWMSTTQARWAPPLPDIPLTVLSRAFPGPGPGAPANRFAEVWQSLQAELATLSPRGELITAERSGHCIQLDEPELVVDAIRRIVTLVRAG